jgi:hypothetical protein
MSITQKDIENDVNKDIESNTLMELLANQQTTDAKRWLKNIRYETGVEGLYMYPKYPSVDLLDPTYIPTIQINREFETRVNKQLANFKKETKGSKVFTLITVTEKFTLTYYNETVVVEPGTYLADGNTRRQAHKLGKIEFEDYLPVIEIVLDNQTDYTQEYEGIDNLSSAEINREKIKGAMNTMGLDLTSTVAKGGNIASALNNAYPNDKRDGVWNKVGFFKREIELLDRCDVFQPADDLLKHQHFYGACLMAAKLYSQPGTTALKFEQVLTQLTALDSETMITAGDKWNGITALLFQLSRPDVRDWIPVEHLRKTNFASVQPSYNFYLYCFELAMSNKMLHRKRGFKQSNWANHYADTLESIK